MNIPEQLSLIYLELEHWHKEKLTYEESLSYFDHMLNSGNIITVCDGDFVVGYVEFWRINYEQLGRLMCGEGLAAQAEDITTGNIAYVANIYILEHYRNAGVFKMLLSRFRIVNDLCTHFCGEPRMSGNQSFRIFKRNRVPERI